MTKCCRCHAEIDENNTEKYGGDMKHYPLCKNCYAFIVDGTDDSEENIKAKQDDDD